MIEPDLAKRRVVDTESLSWHRAGYSVTGSPANLALLRTVRNSLSRRIALKRPKPHELQDLRDQIAAQNAVRFVQPHGSTYNPGHNADTEVLMQPGTGAVRAIAINQKYGNGPGENSIDCRMQLAPSSRRPNTLVRRAESASTFTE